MRRATAYVALALALLIAGQEVPAANGTDFSNAPNAVTWTVDHNTKTINVLARLQIYSSCDDCPGSVNQFLSLKIKSIIERFWNRGLHYRCYALHFDLDITLGTDRFHVDDDRIGVMIDTSPVDIRDHVNGEGGDGSKWDSNDPADRVVPTNDVLNPTRWSLIGASDWSLTYAHEFGHILGLSDQYHDVTDADGNVTSVPNEGAPDDLMSTMHLNLDQSTVDRLVERNGIKPEDLKCASYGFAGTYATPFGNPKIEAPVGAVSCTSDLTGKWAVLSYGNPAIKLDIGTLIADMNDPANRPYVDLVSAGQPISLTGETSLEGRLTPSATSPPSVRLDVTWRSYSYSHDYELTEISATEKPAVCPPT